MSIVKSFAVGNGDMYYVRHNSDNFSIIDCSLSDDREDAILTELTAESQYKGVVRFVSTHPDQDHILGLVELDETLGFRNFYCVQNAATKALPTADFTRYCALRNDPEKAFYLWRGRMRRWMNQSNEERGSSGLNVIWPIIGNEHHVGALADAAAGLPPNNISCILKYSLSHGVTAMWMGDLETDYMEKIMNLFTLPPVDILFAPHHGRTSGRVPSKWLGEMDPGLIIVGEAPSEYLNYYTGYDIVTQNSAGDLLFDCVTGKAHVYGPPPLRWTPTG